MPSQVYQGTKLVVLVIDGPRYTETFGDPLHRYIPHLFAMSREGAVVPRFYNEGVTNTTNGHACIMTGYNEALDNSGRELPGNPSFMQYWLEKTGASARKAWVVASKDKLEVLTNCKEASYHNRFVATSNCGISGLGSGYRDDSITFHALIKVFEDDQPDLVLINLKEPDVSGHRNDWQGYLNGLRKSDEYAWLIWQYLQLNPYYSDQTNFFVTNDHGRHLDGWKDGFVSHGDDCEGCHHISLLALGPDIKPGFVASNSYGLQDLHATICLLLGIKELNGANEPIFELLKQH
jgi:Metalloenzyme superfamily